MLHDTFYYDPPDRMSIASEADWERQYWAERFGCLPGEAAPRTSQRRSTTETPQVSARTAAVFSQRPILDKVN